LYRITSVFLFVFAMGKSKFYWQINQLFGLTFVSLLVLVQFQNKNWLHFFNCMALLLSSLYQFFRKEKICFNMPNDCSLFPSSVEDYVLFCHFYSFEDMMIFSYNFDSVNFA